MILSDRNIRGRVKRGEISISPWRDDHLQPASYDLTLGRHFLKPKVVIESPIIDVARDEMKMQDISGDTLLLHPKMFALGTTEEWIEIGPSIVGRLEGRSSLGRLGILVHSTAGFFDPGFKGNATLEFFNLSPRPILLRAGMRICQMSFQLCFSSADNPYSGKYQNQSGTTPSRLMEDFHASP